MIKVLQIGMTDNLGGIESYLINYYRCLDRDILFDFVNIYDNDLYFHNEIKSLGGKIYKLSDYYKHPIKYINQLIKLIKKNNYNIIHCNMNSSIMLYPLIAAKLAGAKTIIAHAHNNQSDKGLLKKVLHSFTKRIVPIFANQYFACSDEAAKWFFPKKIFRKKEYNIINNLIDYKKFYYNEGLRKKIRSELDIKDNTFVFGNVGRLVKVKNHRFLIDIFNEVHKKNSNSVLLLVGQGPLENKIKEKVNKLGLTDSVKFLGQRSDVNEIYSAMDAFLLPSLYEGLGMVLIEAQVSGLPVITSKNVPLIAEISENFNRIPLKDINAWVLKAEQLLESKRNKFIKESFDISNSQYLFNKYREFNKIKICHFVIGLANGGVEKVILNYFENMNNRLDYDLHIVSQGNNDINCEKNFEKLGFRIHNVTPKRKSIIKNYIDIKKILKENKFDIVHAHMTTTNFFPLFYSLLCGVKTRISHSHSNSSIVPFKEKIFIKLTRTVSQNKFACGKGAAKYLFGTEKNVYIMNNAININDYKYDSKIRINKRKELGIADDSIVIGHVGRFVEQKNHKFIIELFKELVIDKRKYVLLLIGSGELENNIKKQINICGLTDKVMFLSGRNDVNELYQAMDIFILPSLFEGLPVVGVEAQASGLKCFVSNTIHDEIRVTNNIKFLPLDKNIWVNEIKKIKTFDRTDCYELISKKGFNILSEANKLDMKYKKILAKEDKNE